MEQKTFSWPDYAVFAGLLVFSTLIGVFYAWRDRRAKNNEAFLSLKGGQLGLLPVSISLMASYLSAITILAIPGEMYTHGSQFWFCCIGMLLAIIITDVFFLRVLFHLDVSSINEYFSLRFDSRPLRQLCSLVSILGTIFYLGAVLFGPSLAISSVTDLNLWTSIVTIGVVCTFYTTIGGLKAVIWTDVMQMVIMVVGLFVVVVKVSYDLGGLSEVFRIANDGGRIDFFKMGYNVFLPVPTFWDSIIQPTITWAAAFVITQTSFQRITGMPTYRRARILAWLNVPGVYLLTSLACMCGIAIYAQYSTCDPLKTGAIRKPDQLMPYYVMNAFEHLPGLPGLFVACVFSASLSTLSSGLNANAAITWGDFLEPYLKVDGKKQIIITKIIAVFYGLLVIGVAFLSNNVGSILQASSMLAGPLNASLFAVMILGVLCPFANAKGALSSLIMSLIFTLWTGVGGTLISRPQVDLPTSTDDCLARNISFVYSNVTIPKMHTDFQVPSGIEVMQHFSPYFVSQACFVLALVVGIVVSLATGGARGQRVQSHLVHPTILRLAKKFQLSYNKPYWFPQYVAKEVSITGCKLDLQYTEKSAVVDDEIMKTRF